MPRIAINGFGRIGRQVLKAGWGKKGFDVVGINDLADVETLAHLLRYDSNYGRWDVDVKVRGGDLVVGGKKILMFAEKDPVSLPWKKMKVETVAECTGRFVTREAASGHLEAGAKRVILSAPGKGGDVPTVVRGVNEKEVKKGQGIVSNASCTTNCASPVMAVMHEVFGVKKAMLTTVHGYTSTQNLVDGPHKDMRRARAAAVNMIPTSTGAAIATTKVIPDLEKKFDGIAVRVPVPTTSLVDVTMVLKKRVSEEDVKKAFKMAAKKPRWKGVLGVSEEPLVSSDYVGCAYSAVVDLGMTRVVGGDLVKIVAWFDNEWGYAHRMAEMVMSYK